jgi:hypothetical protein
MACTLFRHIRKKTTNTKNVRGIVLNTADLPGSQLQSGCSENVNKGFKARQVARRGIIR